MSQSKQNGKQAESIKDQTRIKGILKRLLQNRVVLMIAFSAPEDGIRANSIILEVDDDAGYLILDKLQPGETHDYFIQAESFTAHANYMGININFISTLNKVDIEDEIYYKVAFPDKINYLQRRAAHRVDIDNLEPVPVTLILQNDSLLEGQMEDISIGGIGIIFPQELPSFLQTGDVIPKCMFTLPNGKSLTCSIEVRVIHNNPRTRKPPKIGARFISLNNSEQQVLQRLVTELDRLKMKKSSA